MQFQIEQLIRDRLPEILKQKGITAPEEKLDLEEYKKKLKEKLIIEAHEAENASSPEELTEELADLIEVVRALAESHGIPLEQIERKRLEKKQSKGGFENRTYISHVEIEESNPAIQYYVAKPDQYPPIHPPRPNCLFCQLKHDEERIIKFKHCYALKDDFPVSKGHTLIIPYEHTENWFTAREEVRADILKALHLLKDQLDKEYHPSGYNFGANCGEDSGQTVMHLHLHLIPRYKGDMENPKGGVRGVIPSKQKYN